MTGKVYVTSVGSPFLSHAGSHSCGGAEMRKAYDICFNILTAVGANIGTIGAIFAKVEFEDLRPFMAKLMDLVSYVRENRHIKDVNRYLTSSMDIWFADWLERYERIDQEEGQ